MKKVLSIVLALAMILSLAACGSKTSTAPAAEAKKTYKVGICNFVDDASLNQICQNIEEQVKAMAAAQGLEVEILYDNCNADMTVLNQIIANFISDEVDVMVAIATPVAMAMQAATEDIPVIFAAVSDPVACGVVESLAAPGANLTGTSDYLNTEAVMNLITAVNPGIDKVALLYDLGQDSSTTSINEAKAFLDKAGIAYEEFTGSNTSEIQLAAQAVVDAGYKAAFTPSDNTVMAAELSIYETLATGGVQHYAGADSFALNGAFVGYGVDYANLGSETGIMVIDVLNGADTATTAVKTFDNGLAVVNSEACDLLGINYEDVKAAITPFCTSVADIQTAESF